MNKQSFHITELSEEDFQAIMDAKINNTDLIREYLIHSYLYYIISDTILDDHSFDDLCKDINEQWGKLKSPYKDLVGLPPLKGQDGREDTYPEKIKKEARERLQDYKDLKELLT